MVWRERRRGRRERERNREKDSWHPSVVGDVIEREEGRYEIEKGGERGRERRKKESEREGGEEREIGSQAGMCSAADYSCGLPELILH